MSEPKTIAEAVALVDQYVKQGCGDHSCIFVKPTGMGTNGGCRCKSRPFIFRALAILLKVARSTVASPPAQKEGK